MLGQADGREVNLGLIYPCFLGSRMLGSTVFPWLMSGQSLLRLEDCLVYIYAILGVVFSIVAYDYQVTYLLLSQKRTRKKLACFIWRPHALKTISCRKSEY